MRLRQGTKASRVSDVLDDLQRTRPDAFLAKPYSLASPGEALRRVAAG